MGRPKGSKNTKVEKVSAETGVEAADLERLPVEALEKLDALVPDQESVRESETEKVEERVVVEGKRYVGLHPITGEPVYI